MAISPTILHIPFVWSVQFFLSFPRRRESSRKINLFISAFLIFFFLLLILDSRLRGNDRCDEPLSAVFMNDSG